MAVAATQNTALKEKYSKQFCLHVHRLCEFIEFIEMDFCP